MSSIPPVDTCVEEFESSRSYFLSHHHLSNASPTPNNTILICLMISDIPLQKAHAASSPSKFRPPPLRSALSSSPSNAAGASSSSRYAGGNRARGVAISPGPYGGTPRPRRGNEVGSERLGGGTGTTEREEKGWWRTVMRVSLEV